MTVSLSGISTTDDCDYYVHHIEASLRFRPMDIRKLQIQIELVHIILMST